MKRRFQFRLRTLLLLVLVGALAAAFAVGYKNHARERDRPRAYVRKFRLRYIEDAIQVHSCDGASESYYDLAPLGDLNSVFVYRTIFGSEYEEKYRPEYGGPFRELFMGGISPLMQARYQQVRQEIEKHRPLAKMGDEREYIFRLRHDFPTFNEFVREWEQQQKDRRKRAEWENGDSHHN